MSMVNPIANLESQTKITGRGPSFGETEKVHVEEPVVLDEDEKALFQRYRPIITKVVYKFSYISGYKMSNDGWKYYLGLEFKGIGVNDLCQMGEMVLIKTIRKIKNKNIDNVGAYLFKALYRQLKYHITKQSAFRGLDAVYTRWGEPEDSFKMEDAIAYRELKNIMAAMLDNLDERKRYVIENLYGLNGREIKSKAEIGRSLGVSYQWVDCLHKSGISKIRKNKQLLWRLKQFLN